ncbi:transforming growth factor beta-2 proprotein-like isoform X2 [Ornithodoros turicata]|uniref:transforming growth factor beta-2 proprotein-like isoform X2 n=1 Tax=Ornithodoros turicata TaxID=34597 RepID=UPI003139864E
MNMPSCPGHLAVLAVVFLASLAATVPPCSNETTGPSTPSSTPALQLMSPTPLLRPNASAAQVLQRRADELSNAVSNTSFAETRSNATVHEMRHRKKQQQLMLIRAQILHRLGLRNPPGPTHNASHALSNTTLAIAEEVVRNPPVKTMATSSELTTARTVYSERIQSFYPSCSLPNNTDRVAWDQQGHFRLLYDINFPRPSAGTEISLVSAKLRLYKIAHPDPLPASHNFLESTVGLQDINVSVYQILKPIRSNRRERKHLLVSRAMPADRRGWVEFNVEAAVSQWYRARNRNHGLDVEVRDAAGTLRNAADYFLNMSCSDGTAQEPPFPNIMRLYPGIAGNEMYPTLDLQLAEVLRTESPPPSVDSDDVTGSPAGSRMQRRRRHHTSHDPQDECLGGTRYITFADLGLRHVLHPEGFTYSYCYCRHKCAQEETSGTAGPCVRKMEPCSTASYQPLNVTYEHQGSLVTTTLTNLVATSCTCRNHER